MRRGEMTSELLQRVESTLSRCQAGRSWSKSGPWGMRYGCQTAQGAATSHSCAHEDRRPSLDVDT